MNLKEAISITLKARPDVAEGFEDGYQLFISGVLLRGAREEVGMSLSQLSKTVGVSVAKLRAIENGEIYEHEVMGNLAFFFMGFVARRNEAAKRDVRGGEALQRLTAWAKERQTAALAD